MCLMLKYFRTPFWRAILTRIAITCVRAAGTTSASGPTTGSPGCLATMSTAPLAETLTALTTGFSDFEINKSKNCKTKQMFLGCVNTFDEVF